MTSPTTLITGGAGFIGSHLVRRFLDLGHHVRVIDNFSSGRRENLAAVLGDIELIEGDICDKAACARVCEGADNVLHEAARPSVPRSITEPELSHAVNIDGTFNLLMAARDAGVRRFVYAASSSAYGDAEAPVKGEHLPAMPRSPYAVQKYTSELYLKTFWDNYGLQTLSLRYFNVFGPRQDPSSAYAAAIPAFASRLLKGERPLVYGDGEQTRDFTYIDNVVLGNVLAIEAEETRGQVLNLACGEAVSVNQVIGRLAELLGTSAESDYTDVRPGDVKHSLADISAARALLGYEVQVPFGQGLARALDWYRENL